MPDNKLTDNEIVKALECFRHRILNSRLAEKVTGREMMSIVNALDLINRQEDKCKAYKHYYDECLKDLKNANAENESLKEKNSNLSSDLSSLQKDLTSAKAEVERLKDILICFMGALSKVRNIDDIESISVIPLMTELNKGIRAEIKAEAYKEFAERLKESYDDYSDHSSLTVKMFCYDIDNLLKELVGDSQ